MHRWSKLVILIMLIYVLTGCGGGSTTGSEMTGSYCANVKGVTICTVSVRPYYFGTTEAPNYTTNVDVFQISDCDPGQEGNQPEPFGDHPALATFNLKPLNPYADTPPNTQIIIERVVIDYRIATDSIGAPPIERFEGYTSLVLGPLNLTTLEVVASMSIDFVDLPRKYKYYNDLASGRYSSRGGLINNYVATITFHGRTDTGDRFSIVGNASFSMGAYNYCSLRT